MSLITSLTSRLRCSLKAGQNLEAYYAGLTTQELERQYKNRLSGFLTVGAMWLFAFVMIVGFADADLALILAFGSSVGGTMVALYVDYQKKAQIMEKERQRR